MDWHIRQMQAVWFSPMAAQSQASRLFESAFGQAAEQTQQNSSISLHSPFLSTASAAYDGISRVIQIQPGRIDLVIAPDTTGVWSDTLPSFEIADGFAAARAAIHILSAELGRSSQRFAIVTSAIRNTDDAIGAFAVANETLGKMVPFSDGTDLMAQVNRRTPSKSLQSKGIAFNRLIRVGTGAVQNMQLSQPLQPGGMSQPILMSESHFVEYVIDINTVPRIDFFDDGDVNILVDEAFEIAEFLLSNPWIKGLS